MTGKKSAAKLHHYVPQAYLRGFATDQGRVQVVPLDRSRKPFPASVKKIAAQTHLHTVHTLEKPDEFEEVLSEIENDAISLIREFAEGKFPPSEEDRWSFSYYMALQSVRGPDTRKTLEHLHASMTRLEVGIGGRKNVGKWVRHRFDFEPSSEAADRIWKEATRPGGPPITFSNLAHIRYALETAQALTPYLATRPWTLVRFERRSLITSDAPVSLVRQPDELPWEGVGFATAWGVTFPLTRKLGLLMSDPMVMLEGLDAEHPRVQEIHSLVVAGKIDRTQAGVTAWEKLFNEHTAESAREYVYHHPEDERFVPTDLPEPDLINIRPMSGLVDMEFDGEPMFVPQQQERQLDVRGTLDSADTAETDDDSVQ